MRQGWHVIEPGREFKSGWTIDAICDHLTGVTEGHIDRLLMNVPPGFMKSLLTNVFWPAWEWGPRSLAQNRYVTFSYSSSLTERDNDRFRLLIRSQWYQERWGDRFKLEKDNTIKAGNDRTGWKLATSVGGVGTGERGDRVLVDDPHNVKEGESERIRTTTANWFREVLPSRLNDPTKDAIIVIMQRVHHADVSGIILSEDHGYTHLMLPMEFEPERRSYTVIKPSWAAKDTKPEPMRYVSPRQRWYPADAGHNVVEEKDREFFDKAPVQLVYNQDPRQELGELAWTERFPQNVVTRDKKMLGAFAFAGQYQQRPAPREGAMFQEHWLEVVEAVPAGARRVRGWDLAGTGEMEGGEPAYTAGVKVAWVNGIFYIENAKRARESAGGVERMLLNTASQDGYDTFVSLPQDPGQAGKAQAQALCGLLRGYKVRATPESGDKVTRAEPAAAQAEAGNVKLVRGDWNRTFLDELCSFPTSQFKDQVDAFTRAFNELNQSGDIPRVRRL